MLADSSIRAYAINAGASPYTIARQRCTSRCSCFASSIPSLGIHARGRTVFPNRALRIISALLDLPGIRVLPSPARAITLWIDWCAATRRRL